MMSSDSKRNYSYLFSISLHVLLIIIFSFLKYSYETEIEEYVTIGFGGMGREGSASVVNKEVKKVEEKPLEEEKTKEKVEVPEAKNQDDDNIITENDKKEEKKTPEPPKEESFADDNEGDDLGNFGFEIDFGGKGKRRIYSSPLPAYPDGVSKEVDIKLRFSILPDGTVGTIIPLIKADTRLEMAAIYSLRQWRFEPLPAGVKQSSQNAVIIFPYRLN